MTVIFVYTRAIIKDKKNYILTSFPNNKFN